MLNKVGFQYLWFYRPLVVNDDGRLDKTWKIKIGYFCFISANKIMVNACGASVGVKLVCGLIQTNRTNF